MIYSYDPTKSDKNALERGISFEMVRDFDFETAKFWQDDRKNYPEPRYIALGYLNERLHVLVFAEIEGGIRVISFRKANNREGKKHGFPQTLDR